MSDAVEENLRCGNGESTCKNLSTVASASKPKMWFCIRFATTLGQSCLPAVKCKRCIELQYSKMRMSEFYDADELYSVKDEPVFS